MMQSRRKSIWSMVAFALLCNVHFGLISFVQASSFGQVQSWQSEPSKRLCTILENSEQILRIGDYLLLAVKSQSPPWDARQNMAGGHSRGTGKPRAKSTSSSSKWPLFYVYNWRNGQLNAQPVEQEQLFETDAENNNPDGHVIFASTYDLCSLTKGFNQRAKRHSNSIKEDTDLFGVKASSITRKNAEMEHLEAKIAELKNQLDDIKEKNAIREEYKDLKAQLFNVRQMLDVLMHTSPRGQSSTPNINASRSASTTTRSTAAITTDDDENKVHKEMVVQLQNLTKILLDLKSNHVLDHKQLSTLLTTMKNTFTSPLATTLTNVTTTTRFKSTSAPTTTTTEQVVEVPHFEDSEQCPLLVIATFNHSKWNWESKTCRDNNHGSWLKSVVYRYETYENGNMPRLVPIPIKSQQYMTHLLEFRGTIRSNNGRFVLVRSDLACTKNAATKVKKFAGGFAVKDKVFIHTKANLVKEYGYGRNSDEATIAELINCYGSSMQFTKALRVIYAPQWEAGKQIQSYDADMEKDNYESGDDSEDETNSKDYLPVTNLRPIASKEMSTIAKTVQPTSPSQMTMKWSTTIKSTSKWSTRKSYVALRSMDYPMSHDGQSVMNDGQADKLLELKLLDYSDQVVKDKAFEDDSQSGRNNSQSAFQRWLQTKKYMFMGIIGILCLIAMIIFGTFFLASRSRNAIEDMSEQDNKRDNKKKKPTEKSKDSRNHDYQEDRKRRNKTNQKRRKSSHHRSQSKSDKRKSTKKHSKTATNQTIVPPQENQQNVANDYQVKPASLPPNGVIESQVCVQAMDTMREYQGEEHAASDSIDLHEVVVIDPENVLQFCGEDTQMATRMEMMFGESKVIAQLIEMKRHLQIRLVQPNYDTQTNPTPSLLHPSNEATVQDETTNLDNVAFQMNVPLNNGQGNGADARNQTEKIAFQRNLATTTEQSTTGQKQDQQVGNVKQAKAEKVKKKPRAKNNRYKTQAEPEEMGKQTHFYKIGHQSPVKTPSSSPKSKADENIDMRLIEVLHRMKKSLKAKPRHRMK